MIFGPLMTPSFRGLRLQCNGLRVASRDVDIDLPFRDRCGSDGASRFLCWSSMADSWTCMEMLSIVYFLAYQFYFIGG